MRLDYDIVGARADRSWIFPVFPDRAQLNNIKQKIKNKKTQRNITDQLQISPALGPNGCCCFLKRAINIDFNLKLYTNGIKDCDKTI